MFVNAKALAAIVSCALVAHAQSTTTATAPASQSSLPPGLDPCILGCVTAAAASSGCMTFTNLTCVCTSTAFQQAALSCLQANCTTADIAAAAQLQQQQCGALNGSTGTAPASTGASTSARASASSAPSSSTSSSAAMALSAPFTLGGLVGTLVASAGALVGAAFIL